MRIANVAYYPYFKPAGVVVFDTPAGEREFHRRYPYGHVKAVRAYAGERLEGLDGIIKDLLGFVIPVAFVAMTLFVFLRYAFLSPREKERLARQFPKYFEEED